VRTSDLRRLTETRATHPGRIGELAAARKRPRSPLGPSGRALSTNNACAPRAAGATVSRGFSAATTHEAEELMSRAD